jgi:hypothetical protein
MIETMAQRREFTLLGIVGNARSHWIEIDIHHAR